MIFNDSFYLKGIVVYWTVQNKAKTKIIVFCVQQIPNREEKFYNCSMNVENTAPIILPQLYRDNF